MKIFVTGGAGFIGSAVVRLAVERGHHVINVDCLTYAGSFKNVESVDNLPNYSFEQCDIRYRSELDYIFDKHKPDAVMHLAAESHVDRSIDGPSKFIETNVLGTFNLLEAARFFWSEQGSPASFRFHHIGTDEVYGSLGINSGIKFTENTAYNPQNPYSASKASSDHFVRAWHSTYGLPILLTNCSNNYGPYQFPEKLIPLVIINALSGKQLPIYGTGSHIRDWLYVEDHALALLLVLEKGQVGQNYNIGGENEVSNLDLVKKLCTILEKLQPKATGSYSDLITFVTDRPGHDARYAIDPSHIRDKLHWMPSVTIDEGLEKTVKWYLKNKQWWKPILRKKNFGARLGVKT